MTAGFGDWRACVAVFDNGPGLVFIALRMPRVVAELFKDLLDCAQRDPDTVILEHHIFCNDNFLNDPSMGPVGEVAKLS